MQPIALSSLKTRLIQSLKAALIFGIGMSVVYCLVFRSLFGLYIGLLAGVLFGALILLAATLISRSIKITNSDLLPGEHLIAWGEANLLASRKEYGLRKYAFDKFSWIIGMKEKEAIGGKIFATNYRIIFKAHKTNRLRGSMLISLLDISDVQTTSFSILTKIRVATTTSKIEFALSRTKKFIDIITSEINGMSDETKSRLLELQNSSPEKFKNNLHLTKLFSAVDTVVHGKDILVDKWQKKIEK